MIEYRAEAAAGVVAEVEVESAAAVEAVYYPQGVVPKGHQDR